MPLRAQSFTFQVDYLLPDSGIGFAEGRNVQQSAIFQECDFRTQLISTQLKAISGDRQETCLNFDQDKHNLP